MSGNNRNVRLLATVKMSGVMSLSLLPFVRSAPRMIFGWTVGLLVVIVCRVAGRIGLRRSATRAPGDRLHARGPTFLIKTWALFFPSGIGRQCAKLRGSGGGTPRERLPRRLAVLQIFISEADR